MLPKIFLPLRQFLRLSFRYPSPSASPSPSCHHSLATQCGKYVRAGSREESNRSHVRMKCWVQSRPWAFAWNLSFVLALVLFNSAQEACSGDFFVLRKVFFPHITWTKRESPFSISTFFCSQCDFFWGMYSCKFPAAWMFHPFFWQPVGPGRAPHFAILVKPRSSSARAQSS